MSIDKINDKLSKEIIFIHSDEINNKINEQFVYEFGKNNVNIKIFRKITQILLLFYKKNKLNEVFSDPNYSNYSFQSSNLSKKLLPIQYLSSNYEVQLNRLFQNFNDNIMYEKMNEISHKNKKICEFDGLFRSKNELNSDLILPEGFHESCKLKINEIQRKLSNYLIILEAKLSMNLQINDIRKIENILIENRISIKNEDKNYFYLIFKLILILGKLISNGQLYQDLQRLKNNNIFDFINFVLCYSGAENKDLEYFYKDFKLLNIVKEELIRISKGQKIHIYHIHQDILTKFEGEESKFYNKEDTNYPFLKKINEATNSQMISSSTCINQQNGQKSKIKSTNHLKNKKKRAKKLEKKKKKLLEKQNAQINNHLPVVPTELNLKSVLFNQFNQISSNKSSFIQPLYNFEYKTPKIENNINEKSNPLVETNEIIIID